MIALKTYKIILLIALASTCDASYRSTLILHKALKKKSSVEILFPGKTPLAHVVCDYIDKEKKSISFAQYMFSHMSVIEACKKAKKNRGVVLEGVVDKNAIDSLQSRFLQKEKTKANDVIRKFFSGNDICVFGQERKILHHKIMLFEKNGKNNDSVVLMGSANITKSGLDSVSDRESLKGSTYNEEHLVVIKNNKEIFCRCMDEVKILREIATKLEKNREKSSAKKNS